MRNGLRHRVTARGSLLLSFGLILTTCVSPSTPEGDIDPMPDEGGSGGSAPGVGGPPLRMTGGASGSAGQNDGSSTGTAQEDAAERRDVSLAQEDAPTSVDGEGSDDGPVAANAESRGGDDAGGTLPEPGMKLGFIGDTGDGSNFTAVVNLIKNEKAAVVIAGDMTYSANPTRWWQAAEAALGTSYPVFLSRGNHDDSSWSGFLPKARNHLDGALRIAGPHDAAYKTIYKGISLVAIRKGDRAATIRDLFKDDQSVWKICYWHQNQRSMQVGGKADEMGWDVYDTCRELGAMIITGHEHSYQRSKTLTNISTWQLDQTCAGLDRVCVGPGRTFVTVTGLGGREVRDQERCLPTAPRPPYPSMNSSDPSCPIWASINTSNQGATHGALIMEFGVDGNPRKARGIFRDVRGRTIDDYVVTVD